MKQLETIPIPRKGIFWGIQKLMPPKIEGEVYYLWDSSIDEVLEGQDEYPTELAQFETELQAIVSIWLVGFSYTQMLVLFPDYDDVGGIRHRIFSNVCGLVDVKRELSEHSPRQLVDIEYLAIVKVVGVPAGKIHRQVYIDYMAWLNGGPAFWLHTKVAEGSSKIRARIEKKKSAQKKLHDEIDRLEERLMATTVDY